MPVLAPVLENTPTETLHRSVSASIKSPSKKSSVNQPFSRATESEAELALKKAAKKMLSGENEPSISATAADSDKVCWIETRIGTYQLDHQVELLHLQAEADALLMKLQAQGQRHLNEKAALS